jgi:Cdc6-like AAA superfamily ATPase
MEGFRVMDSNVTTASVDLPLSLVADQDTTEDARIDLLYAYHSMMAKSGLLESTLDSSEDQKRRAVLDWLTPIDYSSQQADYTKMRHPGTGQWLLDLVEFKEWLLADGQTLLYTGIPGAGKTILTSIVIEYMQTQLHRDQKVGIAYIYCNFQSQDAQKAVDLLASLLKQLSQGMASLPEYVTDLYNKHKDKRTRPSLNEILRTLQDVSTLYSKVFIIVDALDEC